MALRKRPAEDDCAAGPTGEAAVDSLCQGVKRLKTNSYANVNDPNQQHLTAQQQQHHHHPLGAQHHRDAAAGVGVGPQGAAMGPTTPELDDDGAPLPQGLAAESYREMNTMLRALHFERLARHPHDDDEPQHGAQQQQQHAQHGGHQHGGQQHGGQQHGAFAQHHQQQNGAPQM